MTERKTDEIGQCAVLPRAAFGAHAAAGWPILLLRTMQI